MYVSFKTCGRCIHTAKNKINFSNELKLYFERSQNFLLIVELLTGQWILLPPRHLATGGSFNRKDVNLDTEYFVVNLYL